MKTATLLREHLPGFNGHVNLYKLSEPVEYGDGLTTDHVIVSGVLVVMSGPETYIFPATPEGKVVSWGELEGSFQGYIDHEAALTAAGFEVIR